MFSSAFGLLVEKESDEVFRLVPKLSSLPDAEFQAILKQGSLSGTGLSANLITNPLKLLLKPFAGMFTVINPETDKLIKERLAIGITAFNKCPADLTEAELYSSQIKAAIALTNNCVLQMDTGEGKTYALLPAAYAKVGVYRRVYIICGNEYLAYRDANRTKPYWDYVGLGVQYIGSDVPHTSEVWGSQIIYTTLTTLMFKALRDDLHRCPMNQRILYNALIIDEIDVVLLDDNRPRSITMGVQAKAYDWSHAIEFAQELDAPKEIVLDRTDLSAALTIEGERRLKDYMNRLNLPLPALGQMRVAVENAYVALQVKENQDYVILDEGICSINQISGELEVGLQTFWMTPLAIIKHLKPATHRIELHKMSSLVFLKQFQSLAGMSGTAQEDAPEYLFDYMLPIVRIEPRLERQRGELPDLVFKTQTSAITVLCRQILDAVSGGRPVLVGTQNIQDAKDIYSHLELQVLFEELQIIPNISLITGQDDEKVAYIYEHGGEVGSVIIATQVSGRGVDIRLSEEARRNGGLALFGLERSVSRRHDQQFLGRAGRQGDAYTAQFFLSLDGELLKTFGAESISSMYDSLGLDECIPLDLNMISSAIRDAQSMIRRRDFYRRRYQFLLYGPEKNMYLGISGWMHRLNAGDVTKCLTESFLDYTIEHFINTNLLNSIQDNMGHQQAEDLSELVRRIFADAARISIPPSVLEGFPKENVKWKIKNKLKVAIKNQHRETQRQLQQLLWFIRYLNNYRFSILKLETDDILRHIKLGCKEMVNTDALNRAQDNLFEHVLWIQDGLMPTPIRLKQLWEWLRFLKKNISNVSGFERREKIRILLSKVLSGIFSKSKRLEIIGTIEKLSKRDDYQIAFWTIVNAGINYRGFHHSISYTYRRQESNSLRSNQIIEDAVSSEWSKIENNLSTELMRNLLSDRLSLDTLFAYHENQVASLRERKSETYQNRWNQISSIAKSEDVRKERNWTEELIHNFIMQPHPSLGPSFNEKSLEALLNNFLTLCPINTLQSPEKIASALLHWKQDELRRDVTKERIKINHQWILRFLEYLNKQGMISALPTFQSYVRSFTKKKIHDLKNFHSVTALLQLVFFLLGFALFSHFGKWVPLPVFSFSGFILADQLLFSGFIGKGLITAPLLPLANSLWGFSKIGKFQILLPLLSILLSIYLCALDPVANIPSLLLRIPLFVLVSTIYCYLIKIYGQIQLSTNAPLFSIWIIFSMLTAFLPALLKYGALPGIVFGICLLYCIVPYPRLNQQTVTLLSTQIIGTAVDMDSVQHRIQRTVSGSAASMPHIFAFIASFLLSLCLRNVPPAFGTITHYACLLLYGIILFTLSREVIQKRLSLSEWKWELNTTNQTLIDGASEKDIELDLPTVLQSFRRQLLFRETLLQLGVILFCWLLLSNTSLEGCSYPLFLLVVFASFWFGNHICRTGNYLQHLLSYNGHIVNRSLNFEDVENDTENQTFMQRLTNFFAPAKSAEKITTYVLVVLGILWSLNERFNILDKMLEHIWQVLKF